MSLRYPKSLVAFSIFSLTACAQQSNLQQIQHEIKTLNQDMADLSQQAAILSEQNALNAESTQGAYLLPGAGAPVLLESQIGMLKITLSQLADVAGGTEVTLLVEENNRQSLPSFSGMVTWKTRTDKTAFPAATPGSQRSFAAPSQSTEDGETRITLVLPDLGSDNLRWIRIHDIQTDK